MKKQPNFLVIGAPKCGTTSLFFYLKQHPDIFLPTRKELHYFSYDDLKNNAQGPGDKQVLASLCSSRSEYDAHYAAVKTEHAIGDISPSYLYYGVQKRIKNELGTVKIIAMLRNPTEKAYSQYMHMIREQHESLGFYEALMAEETRRKQRWSDIWRYAESSLYADRLTAYIDCFGQDRVHVILFEEFSSQPQTVLKRFFSFLEIDDGIVVRTDEIYNRTGDVRSKAVANFLSKPSLIKTWLKILIPEAWRIAIRLRVMDVNTAWKPEMDPRAKAYLEDYFAADIQKLEALLGRQTDWRSKAL